MASKIVLVSDDLDFFDYIRAKLELRKSDELFTFSFDMLPEKIHLLKTAVFIVNSENAEEKTLDLLKIFSGLPTIVFSYNEDEVFRRKCFRLGMLDYMTVLTSDSEFRARMIPALAISSLLEKNQQYRDFLVKNEILSENNEVYINYASILDNEIEQISQGKKRAVFGAVSPNDKSKFSVNPSVIESVILNNIRKNDILMNYAPNKYFLLIFDSDIASVKKTWEKILSESPYEIYAGFVQVTNQKRQQLINEGLNKLHEAINYDRDFVLKNINSIENLSVLNSAGVSVTNFKMFKIEFWRKIEQIIIPVFYQIQQKYSTKLTNIKIEQEIVYGLAKFILTSKYSYSELKITVPGFSKINIDLNFFKENSLVDTKRISLNLDEFEAGLLGDLLEQFITEYKKEGG